MRAAALGARVMSAAALGARVMRAAALGMVEFVDPDKRMSGSEHHVPHCLLDSHLWGSGRSSSG